MKPSIKQLYSDNVDSKPINYDFSEGYSEKWDYWEASRCSECNKIIAGCHGEEQHKYIDDKSKCEGYIEAEGPMMNYCYPVSLYSFGNDPELASKAITDLPLCIVHFEEDEDNKYYLALTGGGMDLSWEICEAYMRLGQIPPMHFCSLPGIAGRGQSAKDRWIIAGCRRSAKVMINTAKYTMRKLARWSKGAKG